MKRFIYQAALDFNEEIAKAPLEIWAYIFAAGDSLMYVVVVLQFELFKVGRWFWRKLIN